MLLEEIIEEIETKWNNCWPISSLKPFAILDLISYLFFVKKLDDDFTGKRIPELSIDASFYDEELIAFSWHRLKDMDAKNMHQLFTKQNGIIDLLTYCSNTGWTYSNYFKMAPFVTPTAQLIYNSVAILNIIEGSNKTDRSAIADYLLNKAEVSGQSGQADVPDRIARILVAIMQPSSEDVIWDPLAGNARLLVHSARYINPGNNLWGKVSETEIAYGNISGLETDLNHLRIGSMNMMLNNITNPPLKFADVSSGYHADLPCQPSLILSNLMFTGLDSKIPADDPNAETENARKEVIFLNLILKNIKYATRAAIIVPDGILFSNQAAIKRIREEIVENCNLEAIISLPAKRDALFSGGAMLVFSKQYTITSKVWFYKLPALPEVNGSKNYRAKDSSFNIDEQYTIDTIVNHLRNREVFTDKDDENHFYVTVEQLRANGHNFNFNQYGLILKKPLVPADPVMPGVSSNPTSESSDTIKEEHFAKEIPKVKRSLAKKLIWPVIIIILIGGAIGIYFLNLQRPGLFRWGSSTLPPSIQKDSNNSTATINETDSNATRSGLTIAKSGKNLAVDTSGRARKHYIVISKAYFYSKPNENSRESGYLTHWSNGELIPGQEENNFVYVTFDNHKGRIIKGWLNKKDLKGTE